MLTDLSKYKVTIMLLLVGSALICCLMLSPDTNIMFSIISLLAFSTFYLFYKKRYSAVLILVPLSLGITLYLFNTGIGFSYPYKIIEPVPGMFKGEIDKIIRQNGKVCTALCTGTAKCKYLPRLNNTTLLLTIFKSDSLNLQAGSDILCKIKLRPPRTAIIPTDFDEVVYAKSLSADFLAIAFERNLSVTDAPSTIETLRENLYTKIYKILSVNMHEENAGIAYALITGDKSQIPKQIKREFSIAGTAHILAVSGLHVGLIAAAIYIFLGFISNHNTKFISFTVLLFSYIWLTGFRVTALRAGIMAALYLYFKLRQRQVKAVNIVSAVALINIIINPSVIYSVGFQMSFLAILGIIFFYGKINRGLQNIFRIERGEYKFLLSSLSLSLATSLTLSPMIAYYFGIFSGIGFFANIFIVPGAMLALSLSAVGLLLSFSFVGELLLHGADLCIYIIVFINKINIDTFRFLLFEENALYWSIAFTMLLTTFIYLEKMRAKILFSILILAGTAISFSILESNKISIRIFPREQLTAVEIKEKEKTLFILSERKPDQYARRDISLENYMLSSKGELYIGVTGNCGINLCDKLKDSVEFKYVELDHKAQLLLEKSLDLPIRLSQIIDLNHE